MSAQRLAALDATRGLAVVAMIAYHLSWDLSWFALVDWPVADGSRWRIFAASIAGTFLFVSGISLAISHQDGIRWRPFWRRVVIVSAAALAVSAGTYIAFGADFVRFGILHAIAASSLIAIAFVRLPVLAVFVAAALIISLPYWATNSAFDGQLWLWTGLGQPSQSSVDYVPLAPWAGVTLAGAGTGKLILRPGLWHWLAGRPLDGPSGKGIRLLGRHSLPIYLLHQPLLFGTFWSLAALGLIGDPASTRFVSGCSQSCEAFTGDRSACEMACNCTVDAMKANGKWQPLIESAENPSLQADLNAAYRICLGEAGLD